MQRTTQALPATRWAQVVDEHVRERTVGQRSTPSRTWLWRWFRRFRDDLWVPLATCAARRAASHCAFACFRRSFLLGRGASSSAIDGVGGGSTRVHCFFRTGRASLESEWMDRLVRQIETWRNRRGVSFRNVYHSLHSVCCSLAKRAYVQWDRRASMRFCCSCCCSFCCFSSEAFDWLCQLILSCIAPI